MNLIMPAAVPAPFLLDCVKKVLDSLFADGYKAIKHISRSAEELMPAQLGQREFDRRPWGTYTVLDEGDLFKVKRIEVLPGKRLSYQKHSKRAEHWFVIEGTAVVTLDGKEITLQTGAAIDIPVGVAHRIQNPGSSPLVFIEVQRGEYLGEDDIVRLQDDFGRTDT